MTSTESICPTDVSAFRRPPDVVMRLDRMGSFHQSRLSFMRSLLRRLQHEKWKFERQLWQIDDLGFGCAVYTVYGPQRPYSLVAFSHYLSDDQRSDRVIATAWDATFTLHDGVPTRDDLERLEKNVPLQEAGRISDAELSLSRANKSVRLWQHVVDSLAAGRQPDRDKLENTGYLMRTTAVYGSGKFGAADRNTISARSEMAAPFQAELLSVWLIRAFSIDLVEHVAKIKGGEKAVAIDPTLRRRIGVGNSTGLGMAPFLINHPTLINNWMMAREEAIARVRALPDTTKPAVDVFLEKFNRAREVLANWHSEHPVQQCKLAALAADQQHIANYIRDNSLLTEHPWDRFYRWAETTLSLEGQEQLASLMLEPYGDLVDGLTQCMDADEYRSFHINGAMQISELKDLLERECRWAINVDYSDEANRARVWYISEEKLEPRLGERAQEAVADYEQPLCVGYFIQALFKDINMIDAELSVADFLLDHPQHRHTVRRVQTLKSHPYAEIRDNLIAADMLPIDLLRCKLSFFGAIKFDPRSDRWVRICMYQDAPFPTEWLQTVNRSTTKLQD